MQPVNHTPGVSARLTNARDFQGTAIDPRAVIKGQQYRFEDSLGNQFMIHKDNVHRTEKWGLWPVDRKAYDQKHRPPKEQ